MAIRNTDAEVTLTIDERIVATARRSQRAAVGGNGTRMVSTHPAVSADVGHESPPSQIGLCDMRAASALRTAFVPDGHPQVLGDEL
jgi:hypothetical protein